jgi:hypothetical protein
MMVLLSLLCDQLRGRLFVESTIRGRDQALVIAFLIDPTFIATY